MLRRPEIPYDDQLLVLAEERLLLGGKVRAASRICDHGAFRDRGGLPDLRATICSKMCSGRSIRRCEAISRFDAEEVCPLRRVPWNCTGKIDEKGKRT